MAAEVPKEADYEQWDRLFEAYFEFYGSPHPREYRQTVWKRIQDPAGNVNCLVIRDEASGNLVGFAHYLWGASSWTDKPLCLLNDLYVNSSTRGKGYGKSLILAVKEAAKEHGCFRVQWVTRNENATARKLYDTLATTEFVEYRMLIG